MKKDEIICSECNRVVKRVSTNYSLYGHKNFCSKAGKPISLISSPEIKVEIPHEVKPEIIGGYNYAAEGHIPFPYQLKVLEWAEDKDKLPLFVEMRLGKTPMTIKALKKKFLGKTPRVLIVCPKPVLDDWIRELKNEKITPLIINTKVDKHLRFAIEQLPGWYLTNYETITFTAKANKKIVKKAENFTVTEKRKVVKHNDEGDAVLEDVEKERQIKHEEVVEDWGISKLNWDAVVLDESTKLKDPKTVISKKCVEDFKNVPVKAILAGAPAPENVLNYYQQLKFLFNRGMCGCESWHEFKDKFFQSAGPNKYVLRPGVREYVQSEISQIAYVLKRDQVGRGSEKVFETRFVEMDGEYLDQYELFEENWINKEYATDWAIAAFTYLLRFASGYPKDKDIYSEHKLEQLTDILEENFKNDQCVIWCNGIREINAVTTRYKEMGRTYGLFTGQNVNTRGDHENEFKAGKRQDLICQIQTARMGKDFSVSVQSIYFSRNLSSLDRIQSVDRLIHPDKSTPVLIMDIVCKNSMDHDCFQALELKVTDQDSFVREIYRLFVARTGLEIEKGKLVRK